MRPIFKAAALAGFLALAACGGQGDDSLGENIQENLESQADALDAAADNATNEATEDSLENQADALRAEGDRKEEAIDDADVNAAAITSNEVNAM